ncbi:hypothetical protein FQR65_LT11823 [Abscondita terminalis]|nr:hypothetical protein FQR65_LT11823 [Abscondita terminalis]
MKVARFANIHTVKYVKNMVRYPIISYENQHVVDAVTQYQNNEIRMCNCISGSSIKTNPSLMKRARNDSPNDYQNNLRISEENFNLLLEKLSKKRHEVAECYITRRTPHSNPLFSGYWTVVEDLKFTTIIYPQAAPIRSTQKALTDLARTGLFGSDRLKDFPHTCGFGLF